MVTADGAGLFTSLGGLPLHPLVVHFAVVILPLAAIGLVAVIARPAWRKAWGWLVLVGLVVGAVAAFLAKESGEALAGIVGTPSEHADLADPLPLLAILLLIFGTGWFYATRKSPQRSILTMTLAGGSIVLAIGVTVLTLLVGHTGAEATWAGTLESPGTGSSGTGSSGTESSGTGSSGTESSGTESSAISMADVAQHAAAQDCWSAVNGNAYDLTEWIAQHPGGASVIEGMCGVDASSAFDEQHGGQGRPERDLAQFLLGPVQG